MTTCKNFLTHAKWLKLLLLLSEQRYGSAAENPVKCRGKA